LSRFGDGGQVRGTSQQPDETVCKPMPGTVRLGQVNSVNFGEVGFDEFPMLVDEVKPTGPRRLRGFFIPNRDPAVVRETEERL
jgi:hypothetical protein